MKQWEKLENFTVYAAVIIGTLMLRYVTDYPAALVEFFRSNISVIVSIAQYLGLDDLMVFIQNFEPMLLLLIVGIVYMAAGFFVLKSRKPQMEQGAMLLIDELPQIIKSGTIIYGMAASLCIISIYSVVGVPFGALLIFIIQLAVIIGRIPLAVWFGYLLCERLNVKGYTYLYFFIGGFCMLFCESVYAIGGAFLFFVFPVLALGTLFTLFLYRYCYKVIMPVRFQTSLRNEQFDRKKIRGIIKKDRK